MQDNNFVVPKENDILSLEDKKFFIDLLEAKDSIMSFNNRTILISKLVELIKTSSVVYFKDESRIKLSARRPILLIKYRLDDKISTPEMVKNHVHEHIIIPFNSFVYETITNGQDVAAKIDELVTKYPSMENKVKNYICSTKFSITVNQQMSSITLELLI